MIARYFRMIVLSSPLLIAAELSAQWQNVGVAGSAYGIVAHNGALYAGSQGGPIQRSTDHGDTWTDVNTGITETSNWWLASEQGALFCGTQNGAAFRSADDGATWSNIGLVSGARGFVEHHDTLYACRWYGSSVDYSTDGGLTWLGTQTITGTTNLWPLISTGDLLLVGGQGGGVQRIAHSTDAWAMSNTGLGSTEVYSFARIGGVLFAGTGTSGGTGGVFRSDDYGTTWTASGMDGFTIYALHAMDSLLFAGTYNGGVFLSTDTGATWTAFNNGLTNQQVARLTDDGVYLYAGTLGGGVFRNGITTGVDELRAEPIGIRAFPVPCDDVLTTVFDLNTASEITAQLLDAAGRVVAEQYTGNRPPGTHRFIWNMEALAPGLYSCRVVANGGQRSVRLVRL